MSGLSIEDVYEKAQTEPVDAEDQKRMALEIERCRNLLSRGADFILELDRHADNPTTRLERALYIIRELHRILQTKENESIDSKAREVMSKLDGLPAANKELKDALRDCMNAKGPWMADTDTFDRCKKALGITESKALARIKAKEMRSLDEWANQATDEEREELWAEIRHRADEYEKEAINQ